MRNKIIGTSLLLVFASVSFADKICIKSTIRRSVITTLKRVVASSRQCPTGYLEIFNTAAITGVAGPAGATGATGANGNSGTPGIDGSVKIWGDGSAVDLVLTTNTIIDASKMYRNITITPGVFGEVASGTTIKCSGTMTVNGTLTVAHGPSGSNIPITISGSTYFPGINYPVAKGYSDSTAAHGELVSGTAEIANGGTGGGASGYLSEAVKTLNRLDTNTVGGAGAGSLNGQGGYGGGSVAVYCKNGITVGTSGTIRTNGGNGVSGGGGGAGGIIILASNGQIINSGYIEAQGGSGGAATIYSGEGGGGSGGIVRMIAPFVSEGNVLRAGGFSFGLSSAGTVVNSLKMGGGGGGSCGGSGGFGSDVNLNGSTVNSTYGSPGKLAVTQITGDDVSPLLL